MLINKWFTALLVRKDNRERDKFWKLIVKSWELKYFSSEIKLWTDWWNLKLKIKIWKICEK